MTTKLYTSERTKTNVHFCNFWEKNCTSMKSVDKYTLFTSKMNFYKSVYLPRQMHSFLRKVCIYRGKYTLLGPCEKTKKVEKKVYTCKSCPWGAIRDVNF